MSRRLFTISGPSGAGKTSLCTALLQACHDLKLSVSCTTRNPRPGEINGREYHFLSTQDFSTQRASGGFLEWANVHGYMYGTRQQDVAAMLAKGNDVLLEIDWQGARQVAKKVPETIRIFILPPSLDELRTRLTVRAQDDVEIVARRLAAAEEEITHADEANYQIVNDDFDRALHELESVIGKGCPE